MLEQAVFAGNGPVLTARMSGVGQVVLGLSGFLVTMHAALRGVSDLAVGAGANSEIVPELPVIEIVSAAASRLREGGNFVAVVTVLGEQGEAGVLGVCHGVAVGLDGRRSVKDGIGLISR